MGEVKPDAIPIDQCLSIEKEIEKILSSHIVHRFYLWYILHKLSAKWGNLDDKSEKNIFLRMLYMDLIPSLILKLDGISSFQNLVTKIMFNLSLFFI
jgi:hypothetical protein